MNKKIYNMFVHEILDDMKLKEEEKINSLFGELTDEQVEFFSELRYRYFNLGFNLHCTITEFDDSI